MRKKVAEQLKARRSAVETDFRNEKINYKVREHSLTKVPVILVCGKREAEERTVNMRRLGSRDQTSLAWMTPSSSFGGSDPAGCQRNAAGRSRPKNHEIAGGDRLSRPFFMTLLQIRSHSQEC